MANHDKHYSLKQHKSIVSAGRVQHKPDGIRSAFVDGDSRIIFLSLFVCFYKNLEGTHILRLIISLSSFIVVFGLV